MPHVWLQIFLKSKQSEVGQIPGGRCHIVDHMHLAGQWVVKDWYCKAPVHRQPLSMHKIRYV